MRLPKIIFSGFIALLAGKSLADGAILYDLSNVVDQANESKVLNSTEIKSVEQFRKMSSLFKTATVMTINKVSLSSGLITLVLPVEGKQYQFVGRAKVGEGTKDTVWSGKDKTGASVVIADDDQGTSGVLRDSGRIFQIYALPGKRFYVIVEIIPHPMIEPTFDGSASKIQGK